MQTTSGEQNFGYYIEKMGCGLIYYNQDAMRLAGADSIKLREVNKAYEAGRRKVAATYAGLLSDISKGNLFLKGRATHLAAAYVFPTAELEKALALGKQAAELRISRK